MQRLLMGSALAALLLFSLACPSEAILGVGDIVFDPSVWGETFATVAQMIQQVANSAEQVVQETETAKNTVTMIANQVKNLQRMPAGTNVFDFVDRYAGQLQGILATTNGLSFTTNQAMTRFNALYTQAASAGDGANALGNWRKQMASSRLEASATAVQLQSIRTNATDTLNRLGTILNSVWQGQGNLDVSQVHAQQAALQTQTQQWQQAMEAAGGRVQVQRDAEEAALEVRRQELLEAQSAPLESYTSTRQELPQYRW